MEPSQIYDNGCILILALTLQITCCQIPAQLPL